jgi:hypothetical protein
MTAKTSHRRKPKPPPISVTGVKNISLTEMLEPIAKEHMQSKSSETIRLKFSQRLLNATAPM